MVNRRNNVFEVANMEEIFSELLRDASSSKLKGLQEACQSANAFLQDGSVKGALEPHLLRETCLRALKLALESRSTKLAALALSGLQKLLSDERFRSVHEEEKVEFQFPAQFLYAVVSTPSLQEDMQVEIMKLLLVISCSESCEVHGDYLIKIVEVSSETHIRAHPGPAKTASKATLTQTLSSVCHRLQESLVQKSADPSKKGIELIQTDASKVLSQDVVLLIRHFSFKVQSVQVPGPHSTVLALYLECLHVILSNLSKAIRQNKDFVNVVWQVLCPALIQLLGNPANDVAKRGKPIGYQGYPDDGRSSRNSPTAGNRFPSAGMAKIIYNIAGELVRIVGTMSSLRPTLESLFHRIILYPHPQHRVEALKVLREILGSPQKLIEVAGATEDDRDPNASPSPTDQRKTELDLFKLIISGIEESSRFSDPAICSASVACVVALLNSLEEIAQGRGLTKENVENLSRIAELENWQDVYGSASAKEGVQPTTSPNLISGNLGDSESDTDDEEKRIKPKHIRWQMDYEEKSESDQDDSQISNAQKTVRWASVNEERIIDNRDELSAFGYPKGRTKLAPLRKSSIPKPKVAGYKGVKSRIDSGLRALKPAKRRDEFKPDGLRRSASAEDLAPQPPKGDIRSFRPLLRRTKSTSFLVIGKSNQNRAIEVDDAFFSKYWKRGVNARKSSTALLKRATFSFKPNKILASSDDDKVDKSIMDDGPKSPRPILRRARSFNEGDKKVLAKDQTKEASSPEKKITPERQTPRQIPRLKSIKVDDLKSPSKETTINGIPLSKLPKSNNKAPVKPKVAPVKPEESEKSLEEKEKEGARNFARCLLGILPSVLMSTEPSATDESLQQFASDVCEAVSCMALKRKNVPDFGAVRQHDIEPHKLQIADPSLNADGVYWTVYAALKLSYQLNKIGYYERRGMAVPVTQDEFIDSIIKSCVCVRLSRVWLGEVHRLITTYNILGKAGYTIVTNESNRALIGVLSESIYKNHPSRVKRPDLALSPSEQEAALSSAKKEGMKFARKLLLISWDQVVDILGVPLDTSTRIVAGNGSIGLALMLGTSEESPRKQTAIERDMVFLSLEGFRRAARLCCCLEIQANCDMILSRLVNASCTESVVDRKQRALGLLSPTRLHAAHVLSMDALLAAGLELGSYAPTAWKHVFKCCMFISHLEHTSFHASETSSVIALHLPVKPVAPQDLGSPMSDVSADSDDQQNFSAVGDGGGTSPSKEASRNGYPLSGVLSSEDACRAVYALSSAVDNLFDSAATTLELCSFKSFLTELIEASYRQLYGKDSKFQASNEQLNHQDNISIQQQMITMNTLHLYHICDVMVRCTRNNNRSLLHVMEAWAIVSPHLIEAAHHRTRHVSKVALTSIHDILSELLKRRIELAHFCFHESLFKPFDSLLATENCDHEIQDQVLYTLYELVEGFGPAIRSGWRSLFSALRNMTMYHRNELEEFDDGDQRKRLVFSIIEHFINVKSNMVFAYSAVNCILCLLRYLRLNQDDTYDMPDSNSKASSKHNQDFYSDSSSILTLDAEEDLSTPTLQLLTLISKRLSTIYIQPSTAIFHGSYSIPLVNMSECQERVWDDSWSQSSTTVSGTSSPDPEVKSSPSSTASSIVAIDDTGILRVWFLVLEGLASNTLSCSYRFQPKIIEVLFETLKSITSVPGPHFSMFVISNLLLPMLRMWLDRGSRNRAYMESTLPNFKQSCGLATQLIAEELAHFLSVEGASDCVPHMLKLLLDLFLQCVAQPIEGVSRLGCSCLRHLLLSAGPQFTEELWNILCRGIKDINDATLRTTKELTTCYQIGSLSFSGDQGIVVKVVARKDSTPQENQRLMQIAEQVFLLESQLSSPSPTQISDTGLDEDDNRSYIFVLTPEEDVNKPDSVKKRITFRSLTVALLANQIMTHMLGSILLESAESAHLSVFLTKITESGLIRRVHDDSTLDSLPGLLSYLSSVNLGILFDCLLESYGVAHQFNQRPGLRSLVQKLARLPSQANLLRQSITALAFYLNTLFQISRHDGESFSISNIKRILTGEKLYLDLTPESPLTVTKFSSKDDSGKIVAPDRIKDDSRSQVNIDWVIRRLYDACNQISNTYQRLHQSDAFLEQDSGFTETFSNSSSTPQSSPTHQGGRQPGPSTPEEHMDVHKLMKTSFVEHKGLAKPLLETKGPNSNSPFRVLRKSADKLEWDSKETMAVHKQQLQLIRRRDDELIHLTSWSQLIVSMLELLLGLPTLQFKSVLPAVFPSVTSLITTVHDPKVRQLVCDVVRRCGSIYGII